MQGVGSESDKVRLSMKLFDSEGVALLQTMQGGAEAIRAARNEARELGVSLRQDQVDAAVKAKNAITRLTASTRGLTNTVAVQLGPHIEMLTNWLRKHVPTAVQFAVDAFDVLKFAAFNIIDGVTVGLQTFYELLGKLPGSLGQTYRDAAAEVEKFRGVLDNNMAAHVLKVGEATEAFSVKAGKLVPALDGVRAGITLTDDEQRALNRTMEEGARLAERMRTPFETYLAQVDRLDQLLAANAINQQTYNRALADFKNQLAAAERSSHHLGSAFDNNREQLEGVRTAAERTAKGLEDSLIGVAQRTQQSFSDMANSILFDIARIITNKTLTQPLAKGLESLLSGVNVGSLFGGPPPLASGHPGRATGGTAVAGRSYVVGERGPEIFTPGRSGAVEAGGSTGTVQINLTIQALDSRSVTQALQQHANEIVGIVNGVVRKRGSRGLPA